MTDLEEGLAAVTGQTYHDQLIREYVQVSEQITLNALVMLALTVRAFEGAVKYVLLEDSDQGDWQYVVGLASALPVEPGDYAYCSDCDPHDVFDDEGWASALDERTEHVWLPFVETSGPMPHWRFLNVDRVLAEVHLPWRPAVCGYHERPMPCLECA